MSKKLRFEEAFNRKMKNISSPNEDVSWQKMSTLLDDNYKPKPFGFFRKYIWLFILSVFIIAGAWYSRHAFHTDNKNSLSPIEPTTTNEKERQAPTSVKEAHTLKKYVQKNSEPKKNMPIEISKSSTNKTNIYQSNLTSTNNNHSFSLTKNKSNHLDLSAQKQAPDVSKTKKSTSLNTVYIFPKVKTNIGNQTLIANKNQVKNKLKKIRKADATNKVSPTINVSEIKSAITAFNTNATPIPDSLTMAKKIVVSQKGDSTKFIRNVKKEDSSITKNDIDKSKVNPSNKIKNGDAKRKYFVSAGIGLHQQIPIGGQKIVAAGYNGNNGVLDYIPSVYLRFEREKKWYLQSEFNYGAPQYVNSFSYFKQTKTDTGQNIISSIYLLKKTFYNQIPFTFNYYIKSNWTVGIGGMFSWFHGAITEKQVNIKNAITQFETNSTQVIPINGFNDSFLYRSQTYLLLQSDFHLQRFAFGLRYARDMQPYIKYTLPNGVVEDKRNWSLEFIVRFRLWKSGKF